MKLHRQWFQLKTFSAQNEVQHRSPLSNSLFAGPTATRYNPLYPKKLRGRSH